MINRLQIGIIIVLTLLCWGCTTSLPKDHPAGSKTYKNAMDIRIMGARRTYLVHIPSDYDPLEQLPLVIVAHGALDTAGGMEKFSVFSDLADRERFIVMYPNGMGIFRFFQHWNAGHCSGKAAADNVDDVGFVADAIEDVRARIKIDPDRIYMVGFSNGGMLTCRFAAEIGDILAAVAPLAASIGGRPSDNEPEWHIPDPVRPLSVITLHGLADNDIQYEGGISLYRGEPGRSGRLKNQCNSGLTIMAVTPGPPKPICTAAVFTLNPGECVATIPKWPCT